MKFKNNDIENMSTIDIENKVKELKKYGYVLWENLKQHLLGGLEPLEAKYDKDATLHIEQLEKELGNRNEISQSKKD